jgi:acetamidase/formamidase
MATHQFEPTRYQVTIGSHDPVLRLADGDSVHTSTVDALGFDAQGVQVAARGNPQTGPFFVDGAEPGDTLAVRIDRLTPSRATGISSTVLAANVLDPDMVPLFARETPNAAWRLDTAAGRATLVGPDGRPTDVQLALAPMLGCFGVAPALGQAISTATSGAHGGNMDYRGFGVGVTAYFPVFARGALFHLGDGHAVQGDGEILGSGIDTSMQVEFTVHVLKGKRIAWPCGEDADAIFTVGNARPLDQALQHATTEMARWLVQDLALDPAIAYPLMGMCVRYDIGNVVDPAYTVVCKMAKHVLQSRLGTPPAYR